MGSERRRTARFELALPLEGYVDLLQPITVEAAGDGTVTVQSTVPGVRGQAVTVRMSRPDQQAVTFAARVVSSEPHLVEGRLLHRVHMVTPAAPAHGAVGGCAVRTDHAAVAAFVRRYPTRVVNISRGGCLVQLPAALNAGTVVTLTPLDVDATPEPIRVTHLGLRRGGAWSHVAGAEFLPLTAPSSRSLRAIAGRFELEHHGAIG
jgi:hypothetical protein